MLEHGLIDLFQHKLNKRSAFSLFGTLGDGIIIGLLVGIDHILHRQVRKSGMPTAEDKRLPQTSHPAVAVDKRMDELKLIVEYAATYQQVVVGILQPVEQVGHQGIHFISRRCHVNQAVFGVHTHATFAEMACVIGQGRHHQAVSAQQVVHREWVEFLKLIIHPDGVFHLLNLADGCNDSLAVDDSVSDTSVEETPTEAVSDNDTNTDTDSFDFNTDDLDSDFSFPDNEDTKAVDDSLAVADTVDDGLVSDTPVEETTADDFNINDFNLDEPSIEDTPSESGNDADNTDAIGGISVTDETPESEINNFMEDKDTKDFDTSLTDGVLSPTDSSLPDFDTDDFGEKDEFSDTADGIDMTDDAISDFSTNELDSNNLDSNSDAVVVSDSGLDLSDLDNDDAFSVPDFDNLNTSSSSTGAFNFDSDFDDPAFALPTASAASAAYNSPNLKDFDTDFNTNTSSSTTSDYSEKKKGGNAAVVVCIICAIICLLATALGLFVLPSRVNLLNMLWNQDEAQTQQSATEQTQSVQETEKVAPVAKENEIIIAPPEVEMIPEKPIEMTLDSEEVGEDGEKKEVEGIRYQIRWGDTLWDIADTYYRNPWLYPRIAKYNNITDPDFIVSGTYITIPK